MKLEDIRKLCEAATPGPWNCVDLGNLYLSGLGPGPDKRPRTYEDAIFIAAARMLVPKLLAVAEAVSRFVNYETPSWSDIFAALAALEAKE